MPIIKAKKQSGKIIHAREQEAGMRGLAWKLPLQRARHGSFLKGDCQFIGAVTELDRELLGLTFNDDKKVVARLNHLLHKHLGFPGAEPQKTDDVGLFNVTEPCACLGTSRPYQSLVISPL